MKHAMYITYAIFTNEWEIACGL